MKKYLSLIESAKSFNLDGRNKDSQKLVDSLWKAFHPDRMSWVGFYLPSSENPNEMILGSSCPKPACSPISIEGACGQAWQQRQTLIIDDVRQFPGYITCDPKDLSEIVVPVVRNGECIAVLDIDSENLAEFSETDKTFLERMLGQPIHRRHR